MRNPFGTSVSATLARLAGCLLVGATAAAAAPSALAQSTAPDFGPNVFIMDPSMTSASIQGTLSSLANEGQFSSNRYAILFKPGTYNIQSPIGYYESVAGLGATPGAVTINGFITPNFGTTAQYFPGTNLTDTFWRSMENLTVNPVTDSAQNAPANTLQWGVSQAAPLRRLQINGGLELTDSYCGNSSGGFIADTVVTGNVNACSQQQWFFRNSAASSFSVYVWNFVFAGVTGTPAPSSTGTLKTVLPTTPITREKPFLYVDGSGNYNVFAPSVQHRSTGASWANGSTPGRSIPIANFFIAQPTMSAATINRALGSGKNLILTPGIYNLDQPLHVLNPDTVVLGLGYATLVPTNGNLAIDAADVGGLQIAGLIIDAGPTNSPVLVRMGQGFLPVGGFAPHQDDPSTLSDITLRVGGATEGKATTSLEVNSADVVLDNIWAWRADHGAGAGWTSNTAAHGLIVNGDRVTALGLAVEHYQQEQVLWRGNAGQTIFYQSELPYDPPSQAAWMDGTANGYPSYVVANRVIKHAAYGLGVYSYFSQGINIVEDNAITAPDRLSVSFVNAGTVWLNGSGSITHVINGVGATVDSLNRDAISPVAMYP